MGSPKPKQRPRARESFEEPPISEAVCTYFCYLILYVIGHFCDFLRFIGVKQGPTLRNVSCSQACIATLKLQLCYVMPIRFLCAMC